MEFFSSAAGSPPAGLAALTALTIACASTSAAYAPTVLTSAFLCPVASAKTVSPSSMVCAGRIGACQPILRHLGHLGGLGFVELGVGRHHRDDGIAAGGKAQDRPPGQRLHHLQRVGKGTRAAQFERAKFRGTRPGDDLAGGRVQHIAESVDRHDGADQHPAADLQAGCAQAGFHRPAHAEDLAHRGARSRADVALGHRAGVAALDAAA